MRKLFFAVLCLAIFSTCNSNKEDTAYLFSYFMGNGEDGLYLAYSHDGYHWQGIEGGSFLKPELSDDKLMRDPCIIQGGDGKYHMVWTVSWSSNGIGYASSEDLIHWSEQLFIPVMAHEEEVRNCWAPEITYDAKNDEYMIYWSSTVPGLFDDINPPSEDNYNHRIYYVLTSDFENFSETHLLYEPGFNVIDASIVHDNDAYVMFLKDETLVPPRKDIRVAFADELTGPYSEASSPITGDYWAEGPTSVKINDSWLVYFDKYKEGRFGAVHSPDLVTWEDVSNEISLPEGIRHGSIIEVPRSLVERILEERGFTSD